MFSEERISAADLQRRGERSETVRQVLYDLADRVHWRTVGSIPQEADTLVLTRARAMGWVPWNEREPGKTQYEESLRKGRERLRTEAHYELALATQPATPTIGSESEETCEWCGRTRPKSEMNNVEWGGDPNRIKRICDRCCDEGN